MSTTDLPALVAQIERDCAEIVTIESRIHADEMSCLLKAKAIGDALILAKKALPHGDFKDWCQTNLKTPYSTLAEYKRVAEIAGAKNTDLRIFDGGIRAFLKAHATPRPPKASTPTPVALPAPPPAFSIPGALPKAAAPAPAISMPAPPPPAGDVLSDEDAAALADQLAAREAETTKPTKPTAPAPQPATPTVDAYDADLRRLKAWARTTSTNVDIALIAAVRAVVRAALIAGRPLTGKQELADRVQRIGKSRAPVPVSLVAEAYQMMLELEADGGPLCVWQEVAPAPATAGDIAKAADTMREYAARRQRENAARRQRAEAEDKARRLAARNEDDDISELDLEGAQPAHHHTH